MLLHPTAEVNNVSVTIPITHSIATSSSVVKEGDSFTTFINTKGVKEGDTITKDEADSMLMHELLEYCSHVENAVEVPLKQCMYDALVSWTYNLGPTNLKSSTMLKFLNAENYEEVPTQIKRWNKAGGKVLEGLKRRREAEALLFEGKDWTGV